MDRAWIWGAFTYAQGKLKVVKLVDVNKQSLNMQGEKAHIRARNLGYIEHKEIHGLVVGLLQIPRMPPMIMIASCPAKR